MLGRRGLYAALDGAPLAPDVQRAVLWVLNLSDGAHRLTQIADRSGLPFAAVRAAADRLLAADLLAFETDDA
jgi:aminopeptidase-like protein